MNKPKIFLQCLSIGPIFLILAFQGVGNPIDDRKGYSYLYICEGEALQSTGQISSKELILHDGKKIWIYWSNETLTKFKAGKNDDLMLVASYKGEGRVDPIEKGVEFNFLMFPEEVDLDDALKEMNVAGSFIADEHRGKFLLFKGPVPGSIGPLMKARYRVAAK